MLRTRTSSSRISWASWPSWASVSPCRSAGALICGKSAGMAFIPWFIWARTSLFRRVLSVPFQNESRQLPQPGGGRAEGGELLRGLAAEVLGAAAALGGAQESRVGQLAPGGVFPHALAGLVGVALDVEEVVGDLEGEPQAAAVGVEALEQPRVGGSRRAGVGGQHPQA